MPTIHGVTWRELEPFGAEVDLDLAAPLTAEQQLALREIFNDRSVLVFRDQRLSEDDQVRFMGYIDTVIDDIDGVHRVSTEDGVGTLGRLDLRWHSDYSYSPHPLSAISLHAIDVVDGETSTLFASSIAGYERLPDGLRARVDGLETMMCSGVNYSGTISFDDLPDDAPKVVHPAVKQHAATGRSYLSTTELHTAFFMGMGRDESAALMSEVFEHLYGDANVFEHRWHNGDLVLWDNVVLQHNRRSLANTGPRTLQRVCSGAMSLYEMYPQFRKGAPDAEIVRG